MTTYIVHGITYNGKMKLQFNADGRLCMLDFSDAELTDKQRKQYVELCPIIESDFITRADRGGAKYEKL